MNFSFDLFRTPNSFKNYMILLASFLLIFIFGQGFSVILKTQIFLFKILLPILQIFWFFIQNFDFVAQKVIANFVNLDFLKLFLFLFPSNFFQNYSIFLFFDLFAPQFLPIFSLFRLILNLLFLVFYNAYAISPRNSFPWVLLKHKVD